MVRQSGLFTNSFEFFILGVWLTMSKSCASSQQVFALCTKLFVGVVSLSIFGGNFVLAKVCLGFISCLLYKVERCMLPGGLKCVSSMAKSIGAK